MFFTSLRDLSELLFAEGLVQFLAQSVESRLFVLKLLSVFLGHARNASRDVCRPARTVGLVDVLAAGALRPHVIKSDLLHVHVELARHFGHDDHNGGARVNATLLFSFGHPLDFVHA